MVLAVYVILLTILEDKELRWLKIVMKKMVGLDLVLGVVYFVFQLVNYVD